MSDKKKEIVPPKKVASVPPKVDPKKVIKLVAMTRMFSEKGTGKAK